MTGDEELLRSLVPGLDHCLRQVDGMADHGSPGWHAARGAIFNLAALDASASLHEAELLLALSDRESATVELMGPDSCRSDEVRAALAALHADDPQLVALAVPQYRPVSDTSGADDSTGSDVSLDTTAWQRWMGQPRRPSAGWSAPGGPGGGQGGHQGTEKPSRVRAVQKRRAKRERAARKRAAAVQRFRTRGGR